MILKPSQIFRFYLNDLYDVDVTGVTDNQYLQYDSASGEWGAVTLSTTVKLNDITNPTADTAFNMTTRQIKFTFTNPAVADGGFEIEASGAFAGDLVHIHQHTGNPGAVDLVHLEADDSDVIPLRVTGAGTFDIISGAISAGGITLTENLQIGTNTKYIHFDDTDSDSDAYMGFQADDNFILRMSAANTARYAYINVVPYTITIGHAYAGGYLKLICGTRMDFQVSATMASGSRFKFAPVSAGNDGMTGTSGEQAFLEVLPAVSQGGTANYAGLLVDVTENSTGSGTKELLALRLATVDKFTVSNAGVVNAIGGYQDNGTPGIDTTWVNNEGNTVTVSGGIITDVS